MTVNENDIEVTSEDIQANINEAMNAAEEHSEHVIASLSGFKLIDDGTNYLKVSHADLQDAKLGVVGKNEYATSRDRAALLQGMLKDALLSMPVTFIGEFAEPTIVKQARGCDQCEASMINGVFCHETGCPNSRKKHTEEDVEASSKKASLNAKKSTWLTADMMSEDPEPYADSEQIEENEKYVLWQTPYADHTTYWVSDKTGAELAAFNTIEEAQNAMATGEGLQMIEEASVAIKEDMPMARSHDSMSHMAQSEEQSQLEAQIKVEHEAANQLMSLLQGMGYGSAKTVEITGSKEGLDIMTAIDDGGSVKAVSIPVSIKEGKVVLPKKALVATLVAKGLDVHAKFAEQFDLEALEKLAAIEERIAFEAAEAEAILAEKTASVEKVAAGEKQPFFDSDDSTMTVQKHLLPNHENLKLGDRISDGTDQYEIVNQDGQQNSKGEGDGSLWTLKKCQAPERDDKEVKNKIPS